MFLPDELISKKTALSLSQRIVLLYHELRTSASRYSYVTEADLFKQHADLFVRLRKDNCGFGPELTFDDGHISNYELAAPILQSHELPAQFFITAGWTGTKVGYMGWNELRALHEARFSIGAHGWTHRLLTHFTDEELKEELFKSRLTLEDRLGTSITTMSLPGGRYNRRVLAACAEAGYTQIYTSEPRIEAVPFGGMVGRLNILGNRQVDWMERLFEPKTRLLFSLRRKYWMKKSIRTLLGDSLYAKLWAQVNGQEPEAEDSAG